MGEKLAPATVKQDLSAIRRLFGYLQAGNILSENPAEPVRGLKHNPQEGSTPILTAEEIRGFLKGLHTKSIKEKRGSKTSWQYCKVRKGSAGAT